MTNSGADNPAYKTGSALADFAGQVGRTSAFDSVAVPLQKAIGKAIKPGPAEDILSGAFLGHPLHPVLVTVPIGSWLSVNVLDLTGGNARAARRVLAVGNLGALAAAAAGANDWRRTSGEARRIGLVHAALNDVALMLNVGSSIARRRGRRAKGAVLSLAASSITGVSGWLGGHLSYTLGVGVQPAGSAVHPMQSESS
jgi:uncharacterized membrane protein